MARDGWTKVGEQIAGYRIELAGDTSARNVWLSYDPTQRLRLSSGEQQAVEVHWAERLATGRRFFDLPLYRLLRWEVQGRRLVLRTGATSYKQFLGLPPSRGAAPLAVSAVSITSDGHAIMHQRSTQVAELGGLWHVTPAGHPHPRDTIAGTAWTELDEELAVGRDEVVNDSLHATGLAINVRTGKPEVTLMLRLSLMAKDVLSRKAIDSWEYTRLEPLRWSAESVREWLEANVASTVPVGHAALLLAGRVDFGEAWYDRLVASLQRAGLEARRT